MNKPLIALLLGALAFGPALALADDFDAKPLSKMDAQERKAAIAAAKATWDKMSQEEKAAAKLAAVKKKKSDQSALDSIATEGWTVEEAHRQEMEAMTKNKHRAPDPQDR